MNTHIGERYPQYTWATCARCGRSIYHQERYDDLGWYGIEDPYCDVREIRVSTVCHGGGVHGPMTPDDVLQDLLQMERDLL